MNKKVMVVAVAAALAAPAALAQTTVTIGGTINIMWDQVKANGATRPASATNEFNMLTHDRVRDGAGSNIRFFVGEELGGGNQAFIQVETAVIGNSDTRANNLGSVAGATTNVWGNRNSAIGLRSKPAGRFLIGVWDVHYDEMYGIESGWLIANSGSSALAVWQNFGSAFTLNPTTGGRFSNVIRWDSPQWGGFSLSAAYSRPSDAPPANAPTSGAVAGTQSSIHDKNNRLWHFAARYQVGGLQVRYSYLQDKNAANVASVSWGGATGNFFQTSANKITSNRLGVRYRFPFGLGLGFVWDQSKWSATTDTAVDTNSSIKRTSWAFPVTYEVGNHGIYGTYGRARDWKGTFAGCSVSDNTTAGCPNVVINAALAAGSAYTLSNDSGSRFITLGYSYKLSQRTNVHVSYQKISNDPLARYDFFANTSGTAAANAGADPRSFAVGMRHTF